MALENYRDISHYGGDMAEGFQFEFYCNCCKRTWKSAYQPYRLGQVAGLFARLAPIFRVNLYAHQGITGVGDAGKRGARNKALAAALKQAETMYTICPSCNKEACNDCFDPKQGLCENCQQAARSASAAGGPAASGASSSGALKCPNCQAPNAGGRFCAECGFDMASTHKTCPSCGAMALRQARFCTDCGHSF